MGPDRWPSWLLSSGSDYGTAPEGPRTQHLRSAFLVVEPSKIRFLIEDTIPQKEDIILLYIGYHSIPKLNTTHLSARDLANNTKCSICIV